MDALIVLGIVVATVVLAAAAFVGWLLFWPTKREPLRQGVERVYPMSENHHAPRQLSRAAQERVAREEAQRKIVCPHCQTAGHVTATLVQRKQGVSGGKATSAVLTGGVSLVAVGLSKKGWVTHLVCSNCRMAWDVG